MVNDPKGQCDWGSHQARFVFLFPARSLSIIVDDRRGNPSSLQRGHWRRRHKEIHVRLFKYFQSPKWQRATNNLTTIKQISIFHQAKWWLSWNETAEDIGNIGTCHTIFGRVTSVRYSYLTSFVPFLEMLRWKNRFSTAEDWQWTEHPKFDDLWELTLCMYIYIYIQKSVRFARHI